MIENPRTAAEARWEETARDEAGSREPGYSAAIRPPASRLRLMACDIFDRRAL